MSNAKRKARKRAGEQYVKPAKTPTRPWKSADELATERRRTERLEAMAVDWAIRNPELIRDLWRRHQ